MLKLQTSYHADGPSDNRWDDQQLQKTNASSCYRQNCSVKTLVEWLKGITNGSERQELYIHDDTQGNSPHSKNQTVTYALVIVNYHPQKADPHRIWIAADGNLINYPGELSTQTADLTTSKLMWNCILSTKGTKDMCLDIKYFYLTAPLDCFKFMKMLLTLFPRSVIEQYNLTKHALNGFVYIEMQWAVWGLLQAGILAIKLLWKRLLPHGYYECPNMPVL